MDIQRHDVVVGVDGSEAGWHAMEWAAAAAVRRGASLVVVHAYEVPIGLGPAVMGDGPAELRGDAENVLDRACRRLDRTRTVGRLVPPPERVRRETVRGAPAGVLLERTRTSVLVVVGRRGLGVFDRVLMGSVSSAVAALARGPVAVVPSSADVRTVARVVAGIGTDDHAGLVLDRAFEEAELAHCPLDVVHAVDPGILDGIGEADLAWLARFRDSAAAAVRDEAARWSEKRPSVQWRVTVHDGQPAAVVLSELGPRDLVVVGGRRHEAVVGRMLGSVPDRVLRRAPATVLVVHDRP